MTRPRFSRRPDHGFNRGPRVNEQIRKSPVRLIDENNEPVGIVPTSEALDRARAAGLDLVEIAAQSDPPVCRILDYGKFRYEQSKKDKANKQKSKQTEPKEVRLGRSMKIDPHDVQIRVAQARRFLLEGHKVHVVAQFRGREMAFREKGVERLRGVAEALSDIGKVETEPRMNGRRMSIVVAPDKPKIERFLRDHPEMAAAQKRTPIDDAQHEPDAQDEPIEEAAGVGEE